MTTNTELTVGTRVLIAKGCDARRVTKGTTAIVKEIVHLGAEYSHTVKVVLWFQNSFIAGQTISFYARHKNRLADAIINLNDGNPLHKIQVRCKER